MSDGKPTEGKPKAAPADTLQVALSLAAQGWPVFPVKVVPVTRTDGTRATDKRPVVKWLTEATTDAEQVATWWSVGVQHDNGHLTPAGVLWVGVHAARAGIVVVDVDLPKGDDKTKDGARNLAEAGITLPRTLRYKTPSGGRHHVYRAPEGRTLTIARDLPVPGVDIRAGNGLMVYYGPPLGARPQLAPAPEWSLIDAAAKASDRGDGDLDKWLARQRGTKPTKPVRQALAAVSNNLAHDDMLDAVSGLVKQGASGEPGVATALAQARAIYIEGRPDRARDWDNAVLGSIKRHGTPPMTIELTKTERKALKRRNSPEAVEAVKTKRKAEHRIAKHAEGKAAPAPGMRVLEDSPLAVEFAEARHDRWAWTKGLGLLKYDGKRWAEAEQHDLVEEVRAFLDEVEIEEHDAAVRRGDNKAIDKARTLLSRNRARAVSELAIGRFAQKKRKPDAHPHLLNTPSGVVDLRTRELLPHDPELMLTKITGVGYDPDADMTMWNRALEALPPKVAPWFKVRMGQAATGYTPDDDVMLILKGGGENAKSTVLEGIRSALDEFAVTVPDRLLMANPGDHPTELTTLMGARFAVAEELSEGRNLNVKRLKDTVGTPKITARRMRADNITWQATHALAVSTNYLPIVAETDHGTWRRLLLVEFPFKYVKDKADIKSPRHRLADPSVRQHFERGADAGTLRWLVEGAAEWYANGEKMPDPPKRVRRDTDAWRLDADPVMSYLDDRVELDDGYAIACTDLARDFNDYLEQRGHRPWSQQTINSRFEGHVGIGEVKRKRVRFGVIRASRPAFTIKGLAANTQAWVGLRFKDDGTTLPSEAARDAAALADLERRVSS